jgi:DNA repair protein RecO (recombination protein O)
MVEQIKTEAIILKSMRWSDTSKILHIFSREKGYIKAIAKGALRPKSPFRGSLENLSWVELVLSIRENRGLQIITQASLINSFSNIREELDKMSCAYSILELIQILVQYDESAHPLFDFIQDTLSCINKVSPLSPIIFLYQFLIYLSEYLGFGWHLLTCIICKKDITHFPVFVDGANGAVICSRCSQKISHLPFKISENDWRLLTIIQKHQPSALLTLTKNKTLFFENKNVYDMLITHLNYHTEQNLQLKSLKIYSP